VKRRFIPILAGVLISGCQSAPVESKWKPSTLSDQTIAKANAAVRDYQKCLNDETLARVNDQLDPRVVADTILQRCEYKLAPIKAAYDAENVPASISERYMRKNRSQGAQSVLRFVMAVQAMRASEASEARANPQQTR
jgi:hypothetical protein